MQITFLGAAGTVTGSKHLLEAKGTRVLVDCGLFQGLKKLRLRNWAPLPFEPKSLDAVFLTHAHIDHSGYLPLLARNGFAGKIYCTAATADLCRVMLPDSGRIQEEDAEYANRKGFSKHKPALPLYTEQDAWSVLKQFSPVRFDEPFQFGPFELRYVLAGHILGAACIRIVHEGKEILFSGDLGRMHDTLMYPPTFPESPERIVMESTYGNRQHPDADPIEKLGEVVKRTIERGGVLLVPSFAVGRSQTMLYCLDQIFSRGLSPRAPIYLNSPMAESATDLYLRHSALHKLTHQQCVDLCREVTFVRTVAESKALNRRKGPMVIVSASGMLTGGRVLHHLRAFGPDEKNTILLPGFQAPGTRGASLAEGVKEIKVHGAYVTVNAEVRQFDLFSAHAGQRELLQWVGAAKQPPKRVYLVHGEPTAADHLRRLIQDQLKFEVMVPEQGDTDTVGR